jgi:ribosome hibernation promoting factor
MRIDVRGQNFDLTPALEAYVERRFLAALGRFGKRVPRLTIRLSDENALKGGVDKHCRVEVAMPRMRSLLVDEQQADLYAAIDSAADRTSRAVAREIGRRRAKRTAAAEQRAAEKTGMGRRAVATVG